ncbi:CoA ester lyase [Halobacillus sp. Marseille-Q1614]|uniref:HpcH/HpaI aldolase/citrate lyase family protein n=1 Tax=Halobacillus sp. Marseille-Q1614 TaxID=2709134 RepID=UPI0015709AF4|nr:CoA ester lyase [Halobacillus sp. Marseille-Q1614]
MSLYRSYLFVPALKQSMIKKAIASSADRIIIDLEDSVAVNEKNIARENVKVSFREIDDLSRVFIRVNDLHSPFWEEDTACVNHIQPAGIILPKAERAEDINKVTSRILTDITVIPLIETAKGIQNVNTIAGASPKVERLAFGSIDYSLDIDCQLTSDGLELLFARSQIVNASRAAEIEAPIDAVYPHLNNEEGLTKEAELARQLGFKGKLIIHPKQINAVHRIFSLSAEEIHYYKGIVHAFEKAEKQGIASISQNGSLIDYPVYLRAKKMIENHQELKAATARRL